GYILKDANPNELVKAIESVYEGIPYYSSKINAAAVKQRGAGRLKSNKRFAEEKITPRENEVLSLLAKGFSNKEVAKKLYLSARTVETHRLHIMQKLDVNNFAELIKYAISKNIN